MINPNEDGVTHVNIYSKGKTELGRMLTNFAKFPIHTKEDGDFMSVEGYWYWLSIEDCKEKEILRKVYGFWAKKTGKELLEKYNKRFDENFERKILSAIWYKFKRNADLLDEDIANLPFEHYYNYGGKVVDVKDKYQWMFDGIDKMRKKLLESEE